MPIESKGTFPLTICTLSAKLPDDFLERLNDFRAGSLDDVDGDPQVGWVGGHHLLENEIDENSAILGGHLFINQRVAQKKIPSSYLNAICRQQEQAYMRANATEHVPRMERKRIKEDVIERNLRVMPPTIGGTPVVVDRSYNIMYIATASMVNVDRIVEAFVKDLGVEPRPLNISELMLKIYNEDTSALPNVSFGGNAAGADMDITPGRDFLTWLWYHSEVNGGALETEKGIFQMGIEGPLTFGFSAEAKGAEESVVKKGCPQLSAEAKAALAVGKKLKKAKILLTLGQDVWSFTFDADRFNFGGVSLPEGEDMEVNSLFMERLESLHTMHTAFEGYFKLFADSITGKDRGKVEREIRDWAKNRESL